jgi:4-methylaminobutanoate oxidase (formaldehyde-forming)
MVADLPREAKVVIVGGGVVGCSLAYHLTEFGWHDVVLLEQNRLAGGTTWHAAGLIGRLRTSNSLTRINKYSAELYASLERETGHPTGWKQVGSLIVATSESRMTQLRRTAAMSELFGVEVQLIGPQMAQERWPLLRTDDVIGAAWLPHDGKVIPKEIAIALAKGAEGRGARVLEQTRVLGVDHAHGRVTGVRTDRGTINADYVVLTGGMWTRELGLGLGVPIPLYPVEHHYVVSEAIAGAFDELPVGRDPDRCIYFRGEGNAVLLGAFQEYSKPWMVDRIPADFSYQLLSSDWEKFADPLEAGKWRIPALATTSFAKFVNGPESFTPDNNFIMGEAPQLRNLFVAAGFNSVGIASAGGAGKYLAEWMIEGQPTMDLWSVDIRRFGPHANNLSFLRERVTEVLGLHYQTAWPNREFETGRGLRKSPLHDRLAAAGACFGSKSGWERPNWFAGHGQTPVMQYSFGKQNWFERQALEHQATRQAVALFDQTGFSKFLVQGRDAANFLQRLCGNDIDVPVGRLVYTAMLNDRGGFESDLTVLRLDRDEYYLVSGSAQAEHDKDWLHRHVDGARVAIADVTEAYAVLGVMGPKSRELLSRLSGSDFGNDAFPFSTARMIDVGQATVRALRVTYAGELGWELHVPASQACLLYDALMTAGQDLGLVNAGHYALNSLRLEKGYRAWGADISSDDTPLEAGLEFALSWNKSIPFLGREALLRQKADGVKRRLVILVLQDSEPILWGGEPILRNDRTVGYTTSGGYGHTLGASVGMCYVRNDAGVDREFIDAGRYEVNVSGKVCPATAHLEPPYDPQRTRILN